MRTLKDYKNYSEEYRLNENLFKNLINKVVNFFKEKFGKNAFAHLALFLKKKKQLPENKIKIHVPSSWLSGVDKLEKEVEAELNPELATEKFGFVLIDSDDIKFNKLNEAFIDLRSERMKNYDVEDLKREIKKQFKMNLMRAKGEIPKTKRQSLFIWGAPGIGKTEILRSVAEELDIMVEEWILATIDPTDFRGVPYVKTLRPEAEDALGKVSKKDIEEGDPNYTRTISALPEVFPTSNFNGKNDNGGIMFFDEINRAIPMVLGAALSLCLNGRIGRYELPDKWFVVAAGNRLEDLGNLAGTELEPALKNRFSHINYAPTYNSWSKWALSQPHMCPDIIGFLEFFKEYFHQLDPQSAVEAWPSPRQWELASIEHYADVDMDWNNTLSKNELELIYDKHVGTVAATKFADFMNLKKQYSVADIKQVYKDGANAKALPTRLDQASACMTAIVLFKGKEHLTPAELGNLYDFALGFKEREKREPFMSFLKKMHPYIETDPALAKVRLEKLKKWHEITKEESTEFDELKKQFDQKNK